MAFSSLLLQSVSVTVGAGGAAVFPHSLNLQGLAVLPNIVLPNIGTPLVVSAVTTTTFTVTNPDGTAPHTADFFVEYEHSIQRDADDSSLPTLYWQGLDTAAGGGGLAIGAAVTGGTATRVLFEGAGPVLADDAALTYTSGTGTLSATILQATSLTATRVPFAGVGGALTDSANLTFASNVLAVTGAATVTGATTPLAVTVTDGASTAAAIEAATITRLSAGAGVAGNGAQLTFQGTNDAGAAAPAASMQGILRTVVAGAEAGTAILTARQAGAQSVAGWGIAGQWYSSVLALGSLTAAGVTTQTAQMQVVSTFVQFKSNNAGQGGFQFIGTTNVSGSRSFFVIAPSSNTTTTAATEVKFFDYQTHTNQFSSNTAVATQREFSIAAPTYAFATAGGVISDAATLYVSGAPIAGTNATITRSYSLWTDSGDVRHDNIGVALGGGAAATLGTIGGSGPATATQNQWARLNIDGTSYFIPVWV